MVNEGIGEGWAEESTSNEEIAKTPYSVEETTHTITIFSGETGSEHLFFKPERALLNSSFVPHMRIEAENFLDKKSQDPSPKVRKSLIDALGSVAFALSFYLVPIILTVYKPGAANLSPTAIVFLFIVFPFLLLTSSQRATRVVVGARDEKVYWESLKKMSIETYLTNLFDLKPLTLAESRNADTVRFLDEMDTPEQRARAVPIYDRYIESLKQATKEDTNNREKEE